MIPRIRSCHTQHDVAKWSRQLISHHPLTRRHSALPFASAAFLQSFDELCNSPCKLSTFLRQFLMPLLPRSRRKVISLHINMMRSRTMLLLWPWLSSTGLGTYLSPLEALHPFQLKVLCRITSIIASHCVSVRVKSWLIPNWYITPFLSFSYEIQENRSSISRSIRYSFRWGKRSPFSLSSRNSWETLDGVPTPSLRAILHVENHDITIHKLPQNRKKS